MKTGNRIVFNVLLTVFILSGLNLVYRQWFYEADLQEHSPVINLVRAIPEDADILYLGESSNITFRPDDLDKRSISAFIGDHYPGLVCADLTKPASHAGIYRVLLEHIPEDLGLQTLVVTLNLRSFNAQWIYSSLETPLQKSMVLLKDRPPLYSRMRLSFKAYDIKSDAEREEQVRKKWKRDGLHDDDDSPGVLPHENVLDWCQAIKTQGVADSGGRPDEALTNLACHYVKGYAFRIDTLKNPRIADFNAIAELASRRGWNLVFNLMAENVERARELVGEDLVFLMRQNAALLEDYYGRKGVLVVNNLEAVRDEAFIDRDWTTEHYAESGRKAIAASVSRAMEKWHGEEYREPWYADPERLVFFNDCEGGTVWGQMNSLSGERASSGRRSSVTGAGQDFGITLEHTLEHMPDSLTARVKVDFRLFQESAAHEAKIVFETGGPGPAAHWDGISIAAKESREGEWVDFRHSFEIPGNIRKGNFKIYIYNPSGVRIFQDDIRVEFCSR